MRCFRIGGRDDIIQAGRSNCRRNAVRHRSAVDVDRIRLRLAHLHSIQEIVFCAFSRSNQGKSGGVHIILSSVSPIDWEFVPGMLSCFG